MNSPSRHSMSAALAETWRWQNFGHGLALVTEQNGAKIVLMANGRGQLVTRTTDGRLREVREGDAFLPIIAAGPDLLAAAGEVLDAMSEMRDCAPAKEALDRLEAAVRKAGAA